jgi:hypothetical protein
MSNFANYDPSKELLVEPLRGIIFAATTPNPGTEFSKTANTVWQNSANSHLYRGTVDLEDTTDLDALEVRVTALEARMTTAEGDITTLEGDVTTLETNVTTLQGYFVSQDVTMTPSVPAEFGDTDIRLSKSYKTVTMTVEPHTHTFGTPTAVIQYNAQIPAAYRPPAATEVVVPVAFRSAGATDTGLVGSMTVDDNGAVYFRRDTDAAPSDFTGDAGWSYTLTATWLTA